MLDAEADEMCNAQRYERSPDRVDARAGHYTCKLHTKAGEVEGRLTTTTHHPELMMEKNSKEIRLPQYQAPISAVWIMSFFNKIKNFLIYPAIEFLE